ncbi:MAG: SecDF P1 head subdomain-containing protein [Planctomycetota bacterium]|jgi:hypothetical protein
MTNETEIERLIRSAYRGLHPPPAVEEEVQTNLPAERARPRRLKPRRVLWAAAAGVLLAVAFVVMRSERDPATGTLAGEGTAPGLELAVVARPARGVVPPGLDEVHVRLARGGRVLVVAGEAARSWTQMSLDGLAEHLREAAAAFDARERQQGGRGYEQTARGVETSRLRVVLALDRATPWRHVQWLLLICVEQHLPKVAFAVRRPEGREFRLDATLPTDRGLDARAAPVIRASVLVATLPEGVRYRFGDREAVELASVARWLADAKKAAAPAKALLRGEIRATSATPFHHVARLLAEFRQAAYAHVDFHGTAIPDAQVRQAKELPAPTAEGPGPREEGPEPQEPAPGLVFRVAAGDAAGLDRAEEIVRRRLRVAGLGDLAVGREGDTLRVAMPGDPREIGRVVSLVERQAARLEFHLTVERRAPGYAIYWQRLKRALDGGAAFQEVRDVKPEDRAPGDVENRRYPLGLRWYALSGRARAAGKGGYVKDRLPEGRHPYVLCRNDDCRISRDSLQDPHCVRTGVTGEYWAVVSAIQQSHRANMARLTGEVDGHGDTYLAILLDDEVHAAPLLMSTISDAVQIAGGFTEAEARTLAALLGSEPLPVRLEHTERRR